MWGEDVKQRILERIAQGESLNAICAENGMPSRNSVYRWIEESNEFRDKYARAKEEGADVEFDQMQQLADEEPPAPDGKVDNGWVQWQKLRIDTRKWTLARKQPKKYGERTTLAGDPEAPLLSVSAALAALNEAAKPDN